MNQQKFRKETKKITFPNNFGTFISELFLIVTQDYYQSFNKPTTEVKDMKKKKIITRWVLIF